MNLHPCFARAALTTLFASIAVFLLGLYATEWVGHYGYSLFVGLPAVVGFLSVLVLSGPARQVFLRGVALSLIPLGVGAFIFLVTGFEGVICLVMATPVILGFSALGAIVAFLAVTVFPWISGHAAGCGDGRGPKARTTAFVLAPLFIALSAEPRLLPHPPTRMVHTSVAVHGDIAEVWETVVAFPEITSPPGGIFAYGIAYPIRASIEGEGVGAIRRCTFNTGDFVEPITAWDAPNRLAFDVTENPLPMKEWSFWGAIDTPHLHGFMVSERGQFQLTKRSDGTVLLKGTTWYHQYLWPNAYWGAVSDQIIHRIHLRVLNHIRATIESKGDTPAG